MFVLKNSIRFELWIRRKIILSDSNIKSKAMPVVGLERGALSLASTTEDLLETESSGSGLENRDYGRRDPSHWPRGTFYPQRLALTLPTSGGLSVGIVR
jgi:hypothetical protein